LGLPDLNTPFKKNLDRKRNDPKISQKLSGRKNEHKTLKHELKFPNWQLKEKKGFPVVILAKGLLTMKGAFQILLSNMGIIKTIINGENYLMY